LILRNYYFPEMFAREDLKDRLLWIPNGFKSGVGPRTFESVQPAIHRQHLASFMGWIDNPDSFDRERDSFGRMVRSIRKSKGRRFHVFSTWLNRKLHFSRERRDFSRSTFDCEDLYLLSSTGFASGNNVGLYSAIMENSIFAPCPAGNSPETIRLYDALELGCIPISLDHAFLRSEQALAAIGPVPFPILNSWDQLPSFLSEMKLKLVVNPQEILDLQKKCAQWWSDYKSYISQLIAKSISELS
jgi:Exostosin family